MKSIMSVLVASLALVCSSFVFAEVDAATEISAVQSAQVEYPRQALSRGQGGEVLVRYRVNKNGRAEDIEVVQSSSRVFNSAAVRAVRESRYERSFEGDSPVEVNDVVQRFVFVLDGNN